jgi:hypothetical protein
MGQLLAENERDKKRAYWDDTHVIRLHPGLVDSRLMPPSSRTPRGSDIRSSSGSLSDYRAIH